MITLVNSVSPVGILNPVKLDLNYCFRHLLGPSSISAMNIAEGKINNKKKKRKGKKEVAMGWWGEGGLGRCT